MPHSPEDKKKALTRVRRIRGQAEALERALEAGADCAPVLQQLAAMRGAVNGLMSEILESHVREQLHAERSVDELADDEVIDRTVLDAAVKLAPSPERRMLDAWPPPSVVEEHPPEQRALVRIRRGLHALRRGRRPGQIGTHRHALGVQHLNWVSIAIPVIGLTLGAMALVGYFLSMAGLSTPLVVFLLMLFSLPASEGATGLFNTLVSFVAKPARLTGYEFKEGLPAEARTLVVVPCLIAKRDDVDELVRNLEVHYLTNPRGEIYFALLSDWRDSPVEETAADLEILDYAKGQVAELAQRYAHDGKTRFFLLHRRRLYNPAEGCWMLKSEDVNVALSRNLKLTGRSGSLEEVYSM